MKSTALKTIHFLQLLLFHGSEAFFHGGTQLSVNSIKSNDQRKHDASKLLIALDKVQELDHNDLTENGQLNYVVVGGGWGGKMELVFIFCCWDMSV